MMYATKIKMKSGLSHNYSLQEIESIFLQGANPEVFYPKEVIYDWLIEHPRTIRVKLGNEPFLVPRLSPNGEKYVQSEANNILYDNLLSLPRV